MKTLKKSLAWLQMQLSNPRVATVLFFCLFAVVGMYAASGGDAGTTALEKVATKLAKYVPAVQQVCYALAGIVAIVGAISVYIAMQNDEQDVKKKIMMTVGACIFLIAAAQALPLFFGVNVSGGTINVGDADKLGYVIYANQSPNPAYFLA